VRPLKLAVALQLILVFASGALVGGLAYRLYSTRSDVSSGPKRPPGPPDRGRQLRDRYLGDMRSRLKLREDQVQKLVAILDATRHNFFEAKKRSDAEMKALHEDQVAQIRAMLDPAQRAEYEKMLEEREKQMAKDREKGRKRRP
jgi:Spy/CpxP family protein refolding chaperone